MAIINDNINVLFQNSGLTQKEFAEKFGTNQKTIWTYLKQEVKPSGMFTLKICEYYGIDVNFINETLIEMKNGVISNASKPSKRFQVLKKKAEKLMEEYTEYSRKFNEELTSIMGQMEALSRISNR